MLRYRAAAFAGICTQVFWGLVTTMVLTTFYSSTETAEPISLSQAISFIWIGQAILGLLPWTVDKELEAQIKNGHIAYELIRPLRLHGVLFSRSFANRFTPVAMRFLPVFLIGLLCFNLPLPKDFGAGIAFVFSVAGALFLSTAMTTVLMISFFWTIAGEGIQRFIQPLFLFLSGTTLPLPLFPDWTQGFLNVQPFRGLVDIPCRLYTGVIPSDQAFYYIGFQFFWTILLLVVGQGFLNKATKRFVILGG